MRRRACAIGAACAVILCAAAGLAAAQPGPGSGADPGAGSAEAPDPDAGVAVCAAICKAAIGARLPPRTVLNVNTPGIAGAPVVWTRLGRRHYEDDVHERKDPRGRPYYWVGGGASGHEDIAGSDCNAVADGQTSITPMHLDLSAHELLREPPFQVRA